MYANNAMDQLQRCKRPLFPKIFLGVFLVMLFLPTSEVQAEAGDVIEQFVNSWSYSTIGLAYDPDRGIVRYAHESQSSSHNPTVYDVVKVPTFINCPDSTEDPLEQCITLYDENEGQGEDEDGDDMEAKFSLSAVNSGWPWQIDNRTGIAYDPTAQTYLLPDYNGDLSYADDNIVEIDATGTIINAWEMDNEVGSNDSSDGSKIDAIIDIAIDPDNPNRFYCTAAYDECNGDSEEEESLGQIYHIEVNRTGTRFSPNTWRTIEVIKITDDPELEWLGDILGIAWDEVNEGFWLSSWDSPSVAFVDRGFNLLKIVTPGSAQTEVVYNSGVTIVHGEAPGEADQLWLTDFSSDKTTVVDSGFGVQPDPEADLVITKDDGNAKYLPGMKITYTVEVYNNGPDPAKQVTITDTAPDSTSISNWECMAEGGVICPSKQGTGNIYLTVPLFPVGGKITLNIDLQTSLSPNEDLTNTATVNSDTTDPDSSNNSASDTNSSLWEETEIATIIKSDGQPRYTPGTTVRYHVAAANNTGTPLPGVTVTDTVPPGTSMTWTCQAFGLACPASSGSGPINHTVDFPQATGLYYEVDVVVPSDFTGDLSNTASMSDGSGLSESATDTGTQFRVADISVTNSDGVDYYTPGSSNTYTIAVTNDGPSDASNVIIRDFYGNGSFTADWSCSASGGATCPNPGAYDTVAINETVPSFPAGATLTYTVNVDIGADYGEEGGLGATLTNSASAYGDDYDPDETNNTANDTDARQSYTVTANARSGGTITPESKEVEHGLTADFTVSPDPGWEIDQVRGCGGTLNGKIYTTGAITAPCTIDVFFSEDFPWYLFIPAITGGNK